MKTTPYTVTDLNTVISVRISQQLLQTSAVQKFLNENLTCAMLCNANALCDRVSEGHTICTMTHLLNNVGAEFLNRKSTNIPCELTNNSITKAVVIQIKNILDNLGKRILA